MKIFNYEKKYWKKYQNPYLNSLFKPKNQIRLQKWQKIENFWEIPPKNFRKTGQEKIQFKSSCFAS